ncbi:branched-chain amino acid ABC transporter permease [Paraburkholderia sp. BL10I2N1]|uniref:branched-chain amino acid ABC transporter permease n=1 Tax=Paraburkholderia sp. BL10I2N1 TaxID=1938796 RepID=UPI001FB749AB|nr:branched-chain amino acid ABC transporter permease [Paraburkholderia sp. BL10I2N1]
MGLGILLILPYLVTPYALMALRDALVFGLFALSYDLLWGKGGVLTLGHSAFFGLGAYGFAVASVHMGQASVFALLPGLLCAGTVALLVGYFLLYAGVRLHFFAIMSMAVLMIAQQLATSWQSVTGGDVGLLDIPGLSLTLAGHTLDWTGPLSSYRLVAVIVAVAACATWLACRGRYGLVLAAIATNEWRANACGYHTSFHLLALFVTSALLAALAGSLMAACSGVVAPDIFSPLLATEVILWVAVGGRGSVVGPVIAAVAFTRLKQEVSSYSTQGWPLMLGVLFLASVLLLPNGLSRVRRTLMRRRSSVKAQLVEGGR